MQHENNLVARSEVYTGDAATRSVFLDEVSGLAAGFALMDGHVWVTSLQLPGELVTVTSFWRDARLINPNSPAATALDRLGGASGWQSIERSNFEVLSTIRSGKTRVGAEVRAASFECATDDACAALESARRISAQAANMNGFNFTAIEIADRHRIISVTTWIDKDTAAAAMAELRPEYATPPWPAKSDELSFKPGTVVFSSST